MSEPSSAATNVKFLVAGFVLGVLVCGVAATTLLIIPAWRASQAEVEKPRRGVQVPEIKVEVPALKKKPDIIAPAEKAAPHETADFAPIAGAAVRAPREGRLTVPLQATEGAALGIRFTPGFPHKLSATRPREVRKAPPGDGVLYGQIPLVNSPVLLAVAPPGAKSKNTTFFIDHNRDGDLTNDGGGMAGGGKFGSGLQTKLSVKQADGSTFPYSVWLWTSHNHPAGNEGVGFNYYGTTVRTGAIQLQMDGELRAIKILAGDPNHTGAFDAGKVLIDWNGNGKAEDPEWLEVGATCRYQNHGVRLAAIAPNAMTVTLEFIPGEQLLASPDIAGRLTAEPIAGNAPPELGRDLKGNLLTWENFRGKVVLVDFWATWCGPCIREMPGVKAAYAKHHAAGLEIVGVSLDSKVATLQAYVERESIAWPQVCDARGWDSEHAKRWRVESIPATFLIGRNGRIVATRLGGEALLKAIEAELAKKE